MTAATSRKISFAEVTRAASGRWREILLTAGLPPEKLDGKGHPCPKCEGRDRFNVAKNFESQGNAFCRHCFNGSSTIKPGNGLNTIAWLRNLTLVQAAEWIAEYLGMSKEQYIDGPRTVDIVTATANDKGVPVEAFRKYGAVAAKRGKMDVARLPLYNERGEAHSYCDIAPRMKALIKKGIGNGGLFLPEGRVPHPGETWLIVEGGKDSPALYSLGYNAVGLPTCEMAEKYAQLFRGVHVVLVPDLDKGGQKGARRSGGRLSGIAASVKISRLPGDIKDSGGDDVRDILKRPDGEMLVRDAIANAADWKPDPDEVVRDERPEVVLSLNEGFVADIVVKHLGKLGWATPWIPEQIRESVKVFVRGGSLAHVVASEIPNTAGQLMIRTMPTPIVRERITQATQLVVETTGDDGEFETKPERPPKWLIINRN